MSRIFIFILTIIWLFLIGGGLRNMAQYEQTPGAQGTPSPRWQISPNVLPRTSKPTLIMLAHPKCPCTRASLAELKRLLSHCADKVQVAILFFVPANATPDWTATDLWKTAAAIPNVTVLQDKDGAEAKHLQVETSGDILLYSPSGKLLFHGGITIAGGHEGDNPGRTSLENLLLTGSSPIKNTAVYGCPLYRSDFLMRQGDASCRK